MEQTTTLSKFLASFLILSVVVPIILILNYTIFISLDLINQEIEKEEKIKIEILINSINEYINRPIKLMSIAKDLLEDGISLESYYFSKIASVICGENSERNIIISDLNGNIMLQYPDISRKSIENISSSDYFISTVGQEKPTKFYSLIPNSSHIGGLALSMSFSNGVITLFIPLEEIESFVEQLNNTEIENGLSITDQNGTFLYISEKFRDEEGLPGFSEFNTLYTLKIEKRLYYVNYSKMSDTGWDVTLFTPVRNIYKPFSKIIFPSVLVIFILIAFTIFIGRQFRQKISLSINRILGTTKGITNGNYQNKISSLDIYELDQLAKSINQMASVIELRESELKLANDTINNHKLLLEKEVDKQTYELRTTLKSLHDANEKMIESEKLASLGGMVAGIAHEINTPIGIIVTAASYLAEYTQDVIQSIEDKTLSKSKFTDYCEKVVSTSNLILSNGAKSSSLIRSFKQVAVDQSSEEIREFKIGEYVKEILISLHPYYKKTKHKINVEYDEDFIIKSYPGVFSQILTNLITNSITHGFENIEEGTIIIKVKRISNMVNITYSDNGKGIDVNELKKIYDPFFTTKRGQGGSGLGMHIVYNLITQKLHGSIKCFSSIGEGVNFILEFPIGVNDSE